MRLFLVRHGRTSWNISGRAQGHTDTPLDIEGLAQPQRLGWSFEGVRVDRVLSSDLVRCIQTAEPLSRAVGVPLEIRRDLRERSFGDWEGQPFGEIAERLQKEADLRGLSPQEIRPPAGESFKDVWDRLDAVHEMICQSDDDIVVVSHGGALSLLLAKLIRGTLDTCRAFQHANTAVTELERRAEGLFLITRYSDTSHLASERALSGSLDGVAR